MFKTLLSCLFLNLLWLRISHTWCPHWLYWYLVEENTRNIVILSYFISLRNHHTTFSISLLHVIVLIISHYIFFLDWVRQFSGLIPYKPVIFFEPCFQEMLKAYGLTIANFDCKLAWKLGRIQISNTLLELTSPRNLGFTADREFGRHLFFCWESESLAT